jgi:hypothetical protein
MKLLEYSPLMCLLSEFAEASMESFYNRPFLPSVFKKHTNDIKSFIKTTPSSVLFSLVGVLHSLSLPFLCLFLRIKGDRRYREKEQSGEKKYSSGIRILKVLL